ncbi:MAG: alkaline phosphatase family protein [Alphaproteobacteria bacterium]
MGKISNILLVTFDQWRADHLSVSGHPALKTPKLDAFAADAVRFANHYTVTAPCGPARASLLSGLYMSNHRVCRNGSPFDDRFTTLALELRKSGYDPALFGYTDITVDPRSRNPNDPIFDSYEGVLPGMTRLFQLDDDLTTWFSHLKKKGYPLPDRPFDIFRPRPGYPGSEGRGYSFSPPIYEAEDSDAAVLTDAVIDYIDGRDDRPWFAHATYIAPHPPWVVPEPYNARYNPAEMPKPVRADTADGEAAIHPWLKHTIGSFADGKAMMTCVGKTHDPVTTDDAELAQLRATYCGMINLVEDQFDRILTHLKKTGQYENTLIILTADHAEMLGDHWLFGKTGFHDEAFHIPLIIRDPRDEAAPARGRVVDAFTESVDVMPTVLKTMGLPVPRQCDGLSLSDYLEGRDPSQWRDAVHWEFDFRDLANKRAETELGIRSDECHLSVIKDENGKYVHFAALPALFFDLQKDPRQQNNLAQDAASAGTVLNYAERLLQWRVMQSERVMTYMRADGGIQTHADDRPGLTP